MLLAKLVLFRKDYKFAQKWLSLSVGQHRSVSFCELFDLAGNSEQSETSDSSSVHSNESNFINECKTPKVLNGCPLTSKRTSHASCISLFSPFFLFFNVHR